MATTDRTADTMTEHCPSCDAEQRHTVSVELVTESDDGSNAAYSREPYRVSECLACGHRTERRMNNA